MKAKVILITALLLQPTNAFAEDSNAWVKVDNNGNAISGAIVCAQSVCGDPNSLYSRRTLQNNERYVLQALATPDGNVAGMNIGQGTKSVQIDLQTKVWTVVQESEIKEPVITILPNGNKKITEKVIGIETTTQRFTAEYAPWVSPVIQYPTIITYTPIVAPVNTPQQLSSAEVLKIKKKIARLNKKLK
jgi:hypothetical protein